MAGGDEGLLETLAEELEARYAAEGETLAMDATVSPRERGPVTLELEALPAITLATPGASAREDLVRVGELGEGGMGVVELARQRSLGREVAVKRLRAEAGERGAQALLEEAMFMGHLEHPNIVPVHALGRDAQGEPVLVMKRVEGTSWRTLIAEPEHRYWSDRVTARLVGHLEILLQVCNAVHFAHERGVLHRDIKPENVMVGAFGEVYLMDWGVGYRLGRDGGVASMAGTPAYLAPEMVDPEVAPLSPRADVYLLGATLHEVLTGEPRHAGRSLREVFGQALESAPFSYDASVPEELAAICNRACHVDPERRYEDVPALRRAVEVYLSHRASLELAREAGDRLAELESLVAAPEPSPEAVHQRYTEARFGFEMALRGWPDNPQASAGVQASIEALARHELARRDVDAARRLMAELEAPAEGLKAALTGLTAELAEEAEEAARREALAREMDASVSRTQRDALLTVLVFVMALGAGTLVTARLLGVVVLSYEAMIGPPAIVTAALGLLIVARREIYLSNRFNRMVFISLLVLLVTLNVSRGVSALLGMPPPHAMVQDALHGSALAGMAGAVLHRVFWWPAATLLAGSLVGAAWREHLPTILIPFILLAFGGLIVFWMRHLRQRGASG